MNEDILNGDDSLDQQLQKIKDFCKKNNKQIQLYRFCGKDNIVVYISIYGKISAFTFKACHYFVKITNNNVMQEEKRYSIEDNNLNEFSKRLQKFDLIKYIPKNIIYHLNSLIGDDFNINLYKCMNS